jgi:cytochrome c2
VYKLCARSVCLWVVAALMSAPVWAGAVSPTGYSAKMNYTIDCSGCHMADGSGFPGRIPTFRDHIATYLAVPDGREFVAQVPGSAQSKLSDGDLADVLNWIVLEYDPNHVPANFVPYQAAEVAKLRRTPISASTAARAHVLAHLAAVTALAAGPAPDAVPAAPPAAFAICAACHSVSPSGAHSIGPNLRGLIGRQSGSAPGFTYSRAMREAKITWSGAELDSFLQNVSAKVPGTLMPFNGVANADDRKAIIEYLNTLKN